MTQPKHTPLPWKCDPDDLAEYVWGPGNEMIVQMRGHGAGLPKRANAEFIVRAVNNHESLLEACKAFVEAETPYARANIGIQPALRDAYKLALAAIEKAS